MMELVPLALECAAFVSLLSLNSISAIYITIVFHLYSLFCHGCLHYENTSISFSYPNNYKFIVISRDTSSTLNRKYSITLSPTFLKDLSFHVSFHVIFGYMRCCDFSINNLQNTCLVTWLLTLNITFRVKYFIKKSSVLRERA